MANTALAKAVQPGEVSRALLTRGRTTFAAEYRDTLLLLVPAAPGSEVLAALSSSAMADGSFLPTRRLDYETLANDQATIKSLLSATSRSAEVNARTISAVLGESPHFVVPLRKRAAADRMSSDRISVGRATNKDVVLRDGSVSKFHAWFELHEGLDFSVADAGSTNQTFVNGEALQPRLRRPVVVGDLIRFGSIATLLSSAEALWSAIHEARSAATTGLP